MAKDGKINISDQHEYVKCAKKDGKKPSDQDGRIELRSVPVQGLYQPDTLAAYEHRGRTYLVMANEGDARDNGDGDSEDERRGSTGNATIEYVPDGSSWRG